MENKTPENSIELKKPLPIVDGFVERDALEERLLETSVAPRVTLQMVEDNIIAEHYFTAYEARMGAIVQGTYHSIGTSTGSDKDLEALKLLTFCVMVLANGYTVHGVSACASPANYNPEIGRDIARRNAVSQVWGLMGYELRTKLDYQESMATGDVDDKLGRSLTMLLAASLGNTEAMKPEHAKIILSELIPSNIESNTALARICHEANKVWCELNGDMSQKPWCETSQEMKDSAISGVAFVRANPDAGDEAQHNSWMQERLAQGWVYGPEKDPEAKTHPCLVPFDELPHAQQFKDKLFRSIVLASLNNPVGLKPRPPLSLV